MRIGMHLSQFVAIVITVQFVTFPLPAFCADALSLMNGDFDASSKKVRTEIARDLGKKIQTLLQFLPSPKPSELDWLKKEREAIAKIESGDVAMSRINHYLLSPEYQHEKLHSAATALSDALTCAAESKVSLSREMMCWSVANLYLTDRSMFEESMDVLKKAGRLPSDLYKEGNVAVGSGRLYSTFGRGIQEHIVIPHLQRTAK